MSTVVLAIDTATPAVTAGVVRRDDANVEVLAERVTVDARAHAEQLTPNVVAALADAGLTVDDLDAVVVGCGPGPFTGLRVGMATAAAYGHALGSSRARRVQPRRHRHRATAGDVFVVTDARRREVYWARYRDGVRVDGPAVNAPADVPADAEAVAGSPDHAALFDLPRLSPVYPTAAGLVRAVADWTAEPAPLVPLYLRRPDAKPSAAVTR